MNEQGNDIYNLKIDAYTPETIPMARLAEYLSALAELLGEKHSVHFQSVAPGSTQLACVMKREAAYRVARRVENVASANANTPLGHAYRGIQRLLREDSAGA
jgi:leucyl aminopeptidase (aminopeptidase T)